MRVPVERLVMVQTELPRTSAQLQTRGLLGRSQSNRRKDALRSATKAGKPMLQSTLCALGFPAFVADGRQFSHSANAALVCPEILNPSFRSP